MVLITIGVSGLDLYRPALTCALLATIPPPAERTVVRPGSRPGLPEERSAANAPRRRPPPAPPPPARPRRRPARGRARARLRRPGRRPDPAGLGRGRWHRRQQVGAG